MSNFITWKTYIKLTHTHKKVNKSNQTFQFASYRYFYKIPCPYVNKSTDILPVIKIN